jgi:hypothetical protein
MAFLDLEAPIQIGRPSATTSGTSRDTVVAHGGHCDATG